MKKTLFILTTSALLFFTSGGATLAQSADDVDELNEISELESLDEESNSDEESEADSLDELSSDDDSLDGLGSDDDSLDELGSDEEASDGDLGDGDLGDGEEEEEEEEEENPLAFNGYVKPLTYWGQTKYSDTVWKQFQSMQSQGVNTPSQQNEDEFTDVGARVQFRLQGDLGENARLFTAINLDYNEAVDSNKGEANLRVIESYLEIYEGSRTWKIGNQLVTWGFLEGVEVPTDRVNARDLSYNSTEFEDLKMASTGILLTQSLGDFSSLDLMYIPVARTNIDPEYANYFYTLPDEVPARKSDRGKGAFRLFFNTGDLDVAVSYTDGMDSRADVLLDSQGQAQRTYHRVKSPGLDLQYNLGSVLLKLASTAYLTEDEDGDDAFIKNNWSQHLVGAEFSLFTASVNLYAGQIKIENWTDETATHQATNSLMGQANEETNFLSGHVIANFLPGDALGTTVIFAYYWNQDGEIVRRILKPTVTYKISNGLEAVLSPSYLEMEGTELTSLQAEVKYSF